MSFANTIKELRESLNLSQEEFANKLNSFATKLDDGSPSSFNKTNISKWENAKVEPRMDTVRLIAKAFNISPNRLLEIEETKRKDMQAYRIAAHIDDDVSEDEMNDILKYIDFIKSQHKD